MPIPAGAIAERRVAEHFLAADAVRASGAIGYQPGWPVRARAFARLKQRNILKPAPGGWYLDVSAWEDRRRARRKRAALLMGAVAVAGALFVAL